MKSQQQSQQPEQQQPARGGFYRNLLLPGYTDAGASTAFQQGYGPSVGEAQAGTTIDSNTEAYGEDDDTKYTRTGPAETFSDAVTEVWDNRTYPHHHHRNSDNIQESSTSTSRIGSRNQQDSNKTIITKKTTKDVITIHSAGAGNNEINSVNNGGRNSNVNNTVVSIIPRTTIITNDEDMNEEKATATVGTDHYHRITHTNEQEEEKDVVSDTISPSPTGPTNHSTASTNSLAKPATTTTTTLLSGVTNSSVGAVVARTTSSSSNDCGGGEIEVTLALPSSMEEGEEEKVPYNHNQENDVHDGDDDLDINTVKNDSNHHNCDGSKIENNDHDDNDTRISVQHRLSSLRLQHQQTQQTAIGSLHVSTTSGFFPSTKPSSPRKPIVGGARNYTSVGSSNNNNSNVTANIDRSKDNNNMTRNMIHYPTSPPTVNRQGTRPQQFHQQQERRLVGKPTSSIQSSSSSSKSSSLIRADSIATTIVSTIPETGAPSITDDVVMFLDTHNDLGDGKNDKKANQNDSSSSSSSCTSSKQIVGVQQQDPSPEQQLAIRDPADDIVDGRDRDNNIFIPTKDNADTAIVTATNTTTTTTTTTTMMINDNTSPLTRTTSTTPVIGRLDEATLMLKDSWEQQQRQRQQLAGCIDNHNRDNTNTFDGDDGGDTLLDDVSSTGSEMGTVINVGNAAARMVEIDEMAATMLEVGGEEGEGGDYDNEDVDVGVHEEEEEIREYGPNNESKNDNNDGGEENSGREGVDDNDNDTDNDHNHQQQDNDFNLAQRQSSSVPLTSSRRHHHLLHDSGLALPTLGSSNQSNRPPGKLLPVRNRSNGSFTREGQSDPSFDLGLGHYNNDDSGPISHRDGFSTSVKTQKQQVPSKSEMLSAALRRMGPKIATTSGHGREDSKVSLSAPPTPKTPHPAPPRVEDLLRSTLTPKNTNIDRAAVDDSSTDRGVTTTSSRTESETRSGQQPPPSFAIRSPGSSARYSLRFSRQHDQREHQRVTLSPRLSSSLGGSNPTPRRSPHQQYPVQQSSARPSIPSAAAMSPRLALTQTFQFAQKCFSYDNTIDEYNVDDYCDDDEVDDNEVDDNDNDDGGGQYSDRTSRNRRALMTPNQGMTLRLAPRVAPLEASTSFGGYHNGNQNTLYPRTTIRPSQSWDVGSTVSNTRAVNGVFVRSVPVVQRYSRPATARSDQRSTAATVGPFRDANSTSWHQHPSFQNPFSRRPLAHGSSTTSAAVIESTTRGRIHSDFSPTKHSNPVASVELQTPQRIEIEREDALDILACLVERGIGDWTAPLHDVATGSTPSGGDAVAALPHEPKRTVGLVNTEGDVKEDASHDFGVNDDVLTTTKEEKTDDGPISSPCINKGSDTTDRYDILVSSDSMIIFTTEEFRKLSQACGDEQCDDDKPGHGIVAKRNEKEHARRMAVLDELIKSHAYAVEMKRAAVSASAWLKSIGRGHHSTIVGDDVACDVAAMTGGNVPDIRGSQGGQTSGEADDGTRPRGRTSERMELLTLKAMLHNAQLELSETKTNNAILNDELSKCRAEIGRLRTVSRSEHLNRSILDESHDTDAASSVTALSEAISKDAPLSPIARTMSDVDEDTHLFNVSNLNQVNPANNSILQGLSEGEVKERIAETGDIDILVLKNALEKANETIRQLHCEIHGIVPETDTDVEPAPIVNIPDIEIRGSQSRTEASSSSSPDHRVINVRMLDGENFVTDWDDLRPSLPPPPDHGLYSPIVNAVLELWTADRTLHESLTSWMEQVMKGADLQSLPPLTISSLDHQVRDGFIMHVLPLLLRRADIHVGVQTRAHRQTTYDMAVTVTQKPELMMGIAAFPTPHSTTSVRKVPEHRLEPQSLLDRQDSMSGGGGEDEWMRKFEPKISSASSVAHSAVTEATANLPSYYPVLVPPPQTPRRSPRPSPKTDYSSFAFHQRTRTASADNMDEGLYNHPQNSQSYYQQQQQQQPSHSQGSIMGALGGALSGLLSRSKYAASPGRFPSSNYNRPPHPSIVGSTEKDNNNNSSLPMSASLRAQLDLTSSPVPTGRQYHTYRAGTQGGDSIARVGNAGGGANGAAAVSDNDPGGSNPTATAASSSSSSSSSSLLEEQQPYHRVVSAPPGRIGITFVEFRGHAMVSDVSVDSPLSGWVFPSDILIAVDEIPVSGMRVRDIVKILSSRKDRQRAMRVISSHAMNDFTMMDSSVALHEDDEEQEG